MVEKIKFFIYMFEKEKTYEILFFEEDLLQKFLTFIFCEKLLCVVEYSHQNVVYIESLLHKNFRKIYGKNKFKD